MDTLTYPPIQHPMYASQEDMEKGALSPVWALWFQQMQTHAVTYQSEQFFEVYSGEFTDNDPAPGSVSWDKIKVKYNGVRYAVNANGNTSKKYIYWESTNPRVLSAADALWLLTPTCILVGTNQSGTFVPEFYDSRRRVYNAIDEDGTVAAGKVDSFSLADLAVTEQKLADLAVTLQKLAAGAVDITKCASTIRPPEIFAVLPAAGNQGRLVYLTTDNKIYRDTGSVWTLEVDGNDLKAASVIAGKVAAGAIGTTELAAKAATISKLAVIPETLCPDPYFKDTDWWSIAEGWTVIDDDGSNLAHQMGVPRCAELTGATDIRYLRGGPIPYSAAGQVLRFRAKAYNNSNQDLFVGVALEDRNGGDLSLIYQVVPAGAGHVSINKQGTVPTGTVQVLFWIRNTGSGFTGNSAVSEIKLDIAASADLIVDGAITTIKLAADSVTANEISVASLHVISEHVGTVVSGLLIGTTFRTTADLSGNYMEISGTTLKGLDSGGNKIWEMYPAQGPLALTDYSDAGFEVAINTSNLVNLGSYATYDDLAGNPNTTEGMNAAIAAAYAWYASTGFTGRWDVTSLLPTAPRYVLVAVNAVVSSSNKAEIIAGPVTAYATWQSVPSRWLVTFAKANSAIRVGILGAITDSRLVIVPVQKIGASLFIHRAYTGSLTGVTGTIRIVGIFS